MKFSKIKILVLVMFLSVSVIGCVKPPKVEMTVDIAPNETAFLVPLEGANKTNQGKFMSEDYLNENKIATKRITLPQREKKIGRFSWTIERIPTAKVIKVNRAPVTREWTQSAKTGTSTNDDSIVVESRDSIGFRVGVNITAYIEEPDAALFQYKYSGVPLETLIDKNVRGAITAVLSREFGLRDLKACKSDKKAISEIAFNEVSTQFRAMGVTIDNFGLVGGLEYIDKEIQEAINDAYVAEMSIQKTQQEAEAQKNINTKKLSIAVTARQEAEEFAKAQEAQVAKVKLEIEKLKAEATKIAAEKWNGAVPASILPQGSTMLFGLDQ